jgi:actin-related protein
MLLLIMKPKFLVKYILTLEYNSANNDSVFELPDGQTINVGSQKFRCPEALFKPLVMGK